jgi:nucleotide-binding universal stress UspA family protein
MAGRGARPHPLLVNAQPLLVAVDGSPSSGAAVSTALELATNLGSPVRFIHATSPLADQLYEDNLENGPDQEQILAGDPVLADAIERARAAGVEATAEITSGPGDTADLAAVVAGTASGIGARMIVCGSRGRSPAAGAVLGSVSHNLIRFAAVPVLVVHAEPGA